MPPLYKEGLYWLVLLAVTAAVYVVLMIFVGPMRATGAFGLFGLAGLQPLLYRKRRQGVAWDERDTLINYRAVIASYSVFWLFFTAATMGTWAAVYCYGARSTISVHVLPNLMMGGLLVLMTTRAVAIVVQYGLLDTGKGE
ncbi:MAG: hypothetical protein ACLQLG_02445 [Thermoguttaceae bacterium]